MNNQIPTFIRAGALALNKFEMKVILLIYKYVFKYKIYRNTKIYNKYINIIYVVNKSIFN